MACPCFWTYLVPRNGPQRILVSQRSKSHSIMALSDSSHYGARARPDQEGTWDSFGSPKGLSFHSMFCHGSSTSSSSVFNKFGKTARNGGFGDHNLWFIQVVSEQRVVIPNSHGEKLVGMLHETRSRQLVILCHGFRSSKDNRTLVSIAAALTREGISAFRFDFAGNGESEGSFQFGNYRKEAEDLRAVVLYFSEENRKISAIIGHSKGGNVVLLYTSKYHDIGVVVNVSGRFALDRGIEGRLGKDFMQRIKRDGFIDVKNRTGKVEYRVTEESLMDRLTTDMHEASLLIDKDRRVLTIHGSMDEIVPAEDALEFAKLIPNQKLHIIEGADHGYTSHQSELTSIILDFIKDNSNQVGTRQARNANNWRSEQRFAQRSELLRCLQKGSAGELSPT